MQQNEHSFYICLTRSLFNETPYRVESFRTNFHFIIADKISPDNIKSDYFLLFIEAEMSQKCMCELIFNPYYIIYVTEFWPNPTLRDDSSGE
jgi:hypothetical protein